MLRTCLLASVLLLAASVRAQEPIAPDPIPPPPPNYSAAAPTTNAPSAAAPSTADANTTPAVQGAAPSPERSASWHNHEGFLFRHTVDLASSLSAVNATFRGARAGSVGPGFGISFGLGVMLADWNLAPYVELALASFSIHPLTDDDASASISASMLSLGATYYVMPLNLYFAGSVGTSRTTLHVDDSDGYDAGGPAFAFSIGKEWWSGSEWAMGLCARLNVLRHSGDELERVRWISVHLSYTVTYN